MATHEVILRGCRPTPLAHYLKALSILRLVGEQADSSCRGAWRDDEFVLWSKLDSEALVRFFVEEYHPTPVIAPWNGGSGFYPKDNTKGISAIENSTAPRWAAYREAIAAARSTLAELELHEKPDIGDEKVRLLAALRGRLPDAALVWMDAALLLTGSAARTPRGVAYGVEVKYPPLLGTGGNDGRLEFANNFMQRSSELLGVSDIIPEASDDLVRHALLGSPVDSMQKGAAIGQFLPGSAGGANSEADFDGDSLINPWDFILMIEGAVLFASAAVRRHEHDTLGAMSCPFTVHSVGAGYGSASDADETNSRAEIWLPLWDTPTATPELRALLAEGRARLGRRSVRNGVDFARAVVSLGIDRGISGFERIGFQVRNGQSYLATPLGRIDVLSRGHQDPLAEVDDWFDGFRRAASGKHAPSRIKRALRGLETSTIDLCQRPGDPDRTLELFKALGYCEAALVASLVWAKSKRVRPIPRISPQWIESMRGASCVELRLALATASARVVIPTGGQRPLMLMRSQIEPVMQKGPHLQWQERSGRDVAWRDADPENGLIRVLQRRLLITRKAGVSHFCDRGIIAATLPDIAAFIQQACDDALFAQLLWSSTLVDWDRADRDPPREQNPIATRVDMKPPALYGLLKLCFSGQKTGTSERYVPMVPAIIRYAESKNADRACELALRRLRGCNLMPKIGNIAVSNGRLVRRIAASLLFPISASDFHSVKEQLIVKEIYA